MVQRVAQATGVGSAIGNGKALTINQLSHANLFSDLRAMRRSCSRRIMLASWKLTVGILLPVLVANQSRARAIAGIAVQAARTGLARKKLECRI